MRGDGCSGSADLLACGTASAALGAVVDTPAATRLAASAGPALRKSRRVLAWSILGSFISTEVNTQLFHMGASRTFLFFAQHVCCARG